MTPVQHIALSVASASLWAVSLTVLTVATALDHHALYAWSIVIALGACVPTGAAIVHLLLEADRKRDEALERLHARVTAAGVTPMR